MSSSTSKPEINKLLKDLREKAHIKKYNGKQLWECSAEFGDLFLDYLKQYCVVFTACRHFSEDLQVRLAPYTLQVWRRKNPDFDAKYTEIIKDVEFMKEEWKAHKEQITATYDTLVEQLIDVVALACQSSSVLEKTNKRLTQELTLVTDHEEQMQLCKSLKEYNNLITRNLAKIKTVGAILQGNIGLRAVNEYQQRMQEDYANFNYEAVIEKELE